jgi:hypothetical protein
MMTANKNSKRYPARFPSINEAICGFDNSLVVLFCGCNRCVNVAKVARPNYVVSNRSVRPSPVKVKFLNDSIHPRANSCKVRCSHEFDPFKVIKIVVIKTALQLSYDARLLVGEIDGPQAGQTPQTCKPIYSFSIAVGTPLDNSCQSHSWMQFDINILTLSQEHCTYGESGCDCRNPSTQRPDPISETLFIVCACAESLPSLWLAKNHKREDHNQNERAKPRHQSVSRSQIHNNPLEPRAHLTRPPEGNQWAVAA